MSQHSITTPTDSAAAYNAARRRAALMNRNDRGRLLVSGSDRASYLQGLLTNDVLALKPGEGCYAAYLTPQGRMIADMHVYELGDAMLVVTPGGVKHTVAARLDQFVFAEDVRVADLSESLAQFAIVGPRAGELVAAILPSLRQTRPPVAIATDDAGDEAFDVFVDADSSADLTAAAAERDMPLLHQDVAETLRIEGGIPVFGRDMDEDTIPLEAGIESRAISVTKGCYVGQEVIVRVLHRGHGRVARRLVGLTFDGASVPPTGALVRVDGRDVGVVTSSTWSPGLERPIALAFVHRDFIEPGTVVEAGGIRAVVTALPFVPFGKIQKASVGNGL